MLKKIVRNMLVAQIISALTVSLCLLIDNVMICRFLGLEAISAYGLANPILLIIGAIGTMLAAGIQVVCSRSLGMGSQEETNRGYSCALVVTAAVSVGFMALVLLLSSPLATLMGAGKSGALFDNTRNYMVGFIIGAPASMGALILVPFLQMAGQSGLLVAAVLGMTVADVGLDLLNVFVFKGGMFGMGLASSLSYYIALLIGGFYFFSRKCVFRFRPREVTWKKVRELVTGGLPSVFTMASTVILIFVMNMILLGSGGTAAVAAFTVINTIGNASNCISTGMGGVALTLSGILYNEEDRNGLKELMKLLIPRAALLGLGMGALLAIFAPAFVGVFIAEAGASRDMAILGVRLFGIGLIPCCVNSALKNTYQGTGRVRLMEVFSLIEGAALPALAALVCSRIMGTTGAWLYFVLGEGLALAGLCAYVIKRMGRGSLNAEGVVMLREDFGVSGDQLLERDIHALSDVGPASEAAQAFCLAQGQSPRMAGRISLCIEETAANIVSHGFATRRKGESHLSIRLQNKGDRWVLRFRDDCIAFDPMQYLSHEPGKVGSGLRLLSAMADEIHYTNSLSLNNLMVVFHGERKAA